MKKPVTIKDIARRLSISPSTVSRALKNNPEISVETRNRVNLLAKELNYEPNALALSLRQQKTNTIGVVLPQLVHFFFSTVISGIEEIAYANGYNVMICQSNEEMEREKLVTKALYNHRVDGILACISKETTDFEHFIALQDKGIPLVFFDREVPLDASKVVVDDVLGAFNATKHLIDQGHKHLLHLSGPDGLTLTNNRIKGFLKAHEDAGISVNDNQIITCGSGLEIEAFNIVSGLIKSGAAFDGIFAVNDIAAIGALHAVKEAGIKIPDKVAIAGFSNWQFSSFVDPPLTTVEQPGFLMGQKATELILKEIKMQENEFIEPTIIILPTELLIRKST